MQVIRDLLDASPALLLVLGLCLGFMPYLDNRRDRDRQIVIGFFVLIAVRYYMWRIGGVWQWSDYDGADGRFAWTVLGLELLGLCEAIIAIVMLARFIDRGAETDVLANRLAQRAPADLPHVDIYIPTYNEGLDVLEKTILGAANLDWPRERLHVWILDDKKRDWLRDYCARKQIGYLTRADNAHAKAGNINAALRVTKGEFIVIFDADFVPRTNFLRRTIGWFDEAGIGIVQVPHHFYNADPIQANLLLDGVLPDDQRIFFDVIQPSRDAWDAAFCCGSCSVLRRTAVEAIGGGIPTASVTEDILTTLAMKRKGFITRYVNEKLAFGLAAESVEAFFVQRKRWLRGGIQLVFLRDGPLGPGHRLIDRLLFFPASWIAQYLVRIFAFSVPMICLWYNVNPLPGASTTDVVSYQAPFFLTFFLMMRWFQPGHHVPVLTTASQCFAAFRLTPTLFASLVKPFGVPFKVTPKGQAATQTAFDQTTFFMALGFFLATVFGIAVNAMPGFGPASGFFPIVMGWSLWNLIILGIVMVMCFETPRRRTEERFDADEPITINIGATRLEATARDYSLSGARVVAPALSAEALATSTIGSAGSVEIEGVGIVPVQIVAVSPVGGAHSLRLSFTWPDEATRERMILKLFSSGTHPAGLRRATTVQILLAVWQRLFGATWLERYERRKPVAGAAPGQA